MQAGGKRASGFLLSASAQTSHSNNLNEYQKGDGVLADGVGLFTGGGEGRALSLSLHLSGALTEKAVKIHAMHSHHTELEASRCD